MLDIQYWILEAELLKMKEAATTGGPGGIRKAIRKSKIRLTAQVTGRTVYGKHKKDLCLLNHQL